MKSIRLLFTLLFVVLSHAIGGTIAAAALGLDPVATASALLAITTVLGFFGMLPTGALHTLTISDVVTAFGSYYQPRGQNASRLLQLLLEDGSGFDDEFTLLPVSGDIAEYSYGSHDRVLQPFQKAYTPIGTLTMKPRTIQMRRVKVDISETPDDLVPTWLGFLASPDGGEVNVDRTTWPFIRWYIEKYLLPQAKRDMYINENWLGVYAAPTAGTPGAAGTAINGLKKTINVDVAASATTTIATGALETGDAVLFVEQMEAWAENLPMPYRTQPLTINMHDSHEMRFRKGMHEKYNINYAAVPKNELATLFLRTNISVRGHSNMLASAGGSASHKIWCTPQGNAVRVVRTGKTEGLMKIEGVDRTAKIFNDWHIAYGIRDPRILFTNDQELV